MKSENGWYENACQACVLSGRTEAGDSATTIQPGHRRGLERQGVQWLDAGNSNLHQGSMSTVASNEFQGSSGWIETGNQNSQIESHQINDLF